MKIYKNYPKSKEQIFTIKAVTEPGRFGLNPDPVRCLRSITRFMYQLSEYKPYLEIDCFDESNMGKLRLARFWLRICMYVSRIYHIFMYHVYIMFLSSFKFPLSSFGLEPYMETGDWRSVRVT